MAKPFETIDPKRMRFETIDPGRMRSENAPIPVGDLAAAMPPSANSFDARAASHPNVPFAGRSPEQQAAIEAERQQREAGNVFRNSAEGVAYERERQRQLEEKAGGQFTGRLRAVIGAAPVVGPLGPKIAATLDPLANVMEMALSGKTYGEARKAREAQLREAYDAAAQAFPYSSTAASVGYAIAPGLGASRLASPSAQGLTQGLLAGADTATRVKMRPDEGESSSNMRALIEGLQAAGPAAAFGALGPAYVRGAPERSLYRAAEGVTQGETWAKKSLARKFAERAGGEDLDNFRDAMAKAPKVDRVLSLSTSAKRGMRAVEGRMDEISPQIAKIEDGINAAGGIDTNIALQRLNAKVAAYKAAKEPKMLEAATKVRDKFVETFSDEGYLQPTSTARELRNFANDLGSTAFAGDPLVAAPLKARAQKELYREFVGTIEDVATAKLGPKATAELRDLNRQMSVWYAAKNALKDKASVPWRPSLPTVIQGAGGGGLGTLAALSSGDPSMFATALAVPVAAKGIASTLRGADYAMAKVVNAARAGSTKAQLLQIGIEAGLGAPVAGKLAQSLIDSRRKDE